MKQVLFILVLIASLLTASAQDVIVKKDGSTILSKVTEVGATEVKYKKWNNQNGPNYTIAKTDVQTINYENGEKDTFGKEEIQQPQQQFSYTDSQSQMAESLAVNNRLQKEKLLSSAKSWRKASGWVFGISSVGGIITGLVLEGEVKDNFFSNTTYLICCGAGIAVGVGGAIICNSIANNKERLANTITASHLIHKKFNIGNSRLSAALDLMKDYNSKENAIGLGLSLNF